MSRITINRRSTLLVVALAAVAGVLSISACTSEPSPVDPGTVAVAVTPISINVGLPGSGSAAVSITRGTPFAGDVTLSQSGAPAGIGVTFSPGTIAAGSTTSTVNVAVAATVAPGNYPITINAAATGLTTATATLAVVVVGGDIGAFTLSATPTTLTAAAGAVAVTSVIAITRTPPFVGAVALAVTGAPAGVTASVTPASAPGNSALLSVTSTAAALNGTYPLTVRGTAPGLADATTGVSVTVTGGSTQSIGFTFNPVALSVTVGGASATSTVTITRNGGYTGTVNLALTGALAGVTASVSPTSTSGNSATVTVQAGASVPLGTYNITLTGTGTGIPPASSILPVTYTASGGSGVSVTFCTEDAPIWVAAQDGAGAWTQVLKNAGTSTYQFSFPSGKGGVAVVDTVGTDTELNVTYGTLAEFTAFGGTVNSGRCASNKTVSGSFVGVSPTTEFATANLGGSSAFTTPGGSTNFALLNVPAGPQDLVATRGDFTASPFTINRIILRRALNPADGSTLPVLDFNAAEAFAPATANVTVTGLGTDEASIAAIFTGVRGSAFGLLSSIASYTAASGAKPYFAIPLAQLQPNEFQQLSATASAPGPSTSDRTAAVYFRSPVNQTLAVGPALSAPTVTKLVTAPNARPRVQLPGQPQYNRLISANYDQSGTTRHANVSATALYYGSAPVTWDLALPDLSAAAGWTSTWGLLDVGPVINWDVSAQGGAISFLDPTIVDGSTSQSASISSTTGLTLRGLRTESNGFALQGRLLDVLAERSRSPLR